VGRSPSGAPSIVLDGQAKRRADTLGVTQILITFTHEKTSAVAFAVAVRA
jgi:phosphopantetheinyl transferase (holo-ACP synthase)